MPRPFRWQDGERLILFGRGCLAEAPQVLGQGYVLLSTPRALETAPQLAHGAVDVIEVGAGRVDELAGELRGRASGDLMVALGGGRVIDVGKALAASAGPPCRVAAIPTTLSGAEMTPIHRHAAGVPAETPRVRPAIVVCDPALAASQPTPLLAQSAGNALGHALEGPLTPMGNPVASMAAVRAASLLQTGLASSEPDDDARDALALGALLAGYVIGSTGYGIHHVLSQTLVRFAGIGHGTANAVMLPWSIRALEKRAGGEFFASVRGALDGVEPLALAARFRDLGGVRSLSEAGVTEQQLDLCAKEASARPELGMTPPAADERELRELYQAAYP